MAAGVTQIGDLAAYAKQLAVNARQAGYAVGQMSGQQRNAVLAAMAAALRDNVDTLVAANDEDMAEADGYGLTLAMKDRLRLTAERIDAMAVAIEDVAAQPDPVGETIGGTVRPDGLRVEKRRVPLGVVAIIYEARPNVTTDAAALCVKSGNACILRGGKEMFHSTQAIGRIVAGALAACGANPHAVQMVATTDRALVPLLLKEDQYIDVVIPRGGETLIRTVVAESTIPVIKHYTGNCHVYVHAACPYELAESVAVNAKVQRPGVCNAAETLLIDAAVAEAYLPKLAAKLMAAGCELRGCETTCRLVPAATPATEADWGTEYLDLIEAVKVVPDLDAAVGHINRYGSHHTDAILTESVRAAEAFVAGVDSGNVMVNCSTRLSDGGVYGLGAEIGISTDKLHARGPMGAADLTTYKYVVTGQGHLRK